MGLIFYYTEMIRNLEHYMILNKIKRRLLYKRFFIIDPEQFLMERHKQWRERIEIQRKLNKKRSPKSECLEEWMQHNPTSPQVKFNAMRYYVITNQPEFVDSF